MAAGAALRQADDWGPCIGRACADIPGALFKRRGAMHPSRELPSVVRSLGLRQH